MQKLFRDKVSLGDDRELFRHIRYIWIKRLRLMPMLSSFMSSPTQDYLSSPCSYRSLPWFNNVTITGMGDVHLGNWKGVAAHKECCIWIQYAKSYVGIVTLGTDWLRDCGLCQCQCVIWIPYAEVTRVHSFSRRWLITDLFSKSICAYRARFRVLHLGGHHNSVLIPLLCN